MTASVMISGAATHTALLKRAEQVLPSLVEQLKPHDQLAVLYLAALCEEMIMILSETSQGADAVGKSLRRMSEYDVAGFAMLHGTMFDPSSGGKEN